MSKFWSDIVHGLQPYVPGEQPTRGDVIKLNTNENPYPPSPKVITALCSTANADLRRYPPSDGGELRRAIGRHFHLESECVFVGNGSDEVLAHVFQAFLKKTRPLLFPDVTYNFYAVYSHLFGITYERVPLAEDFRIEVDAYNRPNGGIIFPNPNAPTGLLLPLDAIQRLASIHRDSILVVDEAYIDFGGTSAASLVPEYDNLVVVQTFSKSRSLAGLRVGFALAQAPLITALERVKNSFNSYPLGQLAISGATAALDDDAHFRSTCARIQASRERLVAELKRLGFTVWPSAANFVLAKPPVPAATLAQSLRRRRILVRHFDQPRTHDCLRITVGTDAECDRLLDEIHDLLSG